MTKLQLPNLLPKIERISELLEYCKPEGKFYRRSGGRGRKIGDKVGWQRKDGYIETTLDGTNLKVHRLVWFVEHGVWSEGEIDHINGKRDDNRIKNLRDVLRRTNMENKVKYRRADTNLPTGVQVGNKNKFGDITSYRAYWQDLGGKQCKTHFRVNIYGSHEAAIQAAATCRETRIAELNIRGANYTNRHGVE